MILDERTMYVKALPGVGLGRKVALQLVETKYAMVSLGWKYAYFDVE